MNISLQNLDHKTWGDHYFCLDVSQDMTLFIILPSSNECKGLFNTRAFYCSERIFIVNKSFIVLQDLTSFKLYIKVVISQDLDLTLLYADWTCQEINSLTHSHLVVLILFL